MATIDLLENAGFQNTALSLNGRVLDAARIFSEAVAGKSHLAYPRLREAMSRSDYPILLGKAFETEALAVQKDAVREYEAFAVEKKVPDFRPKKFKDLFGSTEFEEVAEGEEYKADSLAETDIEMKVKKFGRRFQWTWELELEGDLSEMADFPKRLGNGAAETENKVVFDQIVDAEGPKADFFGEVATAALTPTALKTAIEAMSLKEDHRGDLVDVSRMVLIVPPSLAITANEIVGAAELVIEETNGSKTVKNRITNPYRDLVQVVVSKRFASTIGAAGPRATSWALVPANDSTLPALILGKLLGHENVDIRVKNDRGSRVGGGEIPWSEGSYMDDTIDFRGRHVVGGAKGFTYGVYASTGTGA